MTKVRIYLLMFKTFIFLNSELTFSASWSYLVKNVSGKDGEKNPINLDLNEHQIKVGKHTCNVLDTKSESPLRSMSCRIHGSSTRTLITADCFLKKEVAITFVDGFDMWKITLKCN
jgi:hypothetical protein